MSIKNWMLTGLALAGLGLAGTAMAQSGEAASPEFDCARVKAKGGKCKFIPIEEEQIEGTTGAPSDLNFTVRPFTKMSSLLRIRADFRSEIIKSAENL